VSWSWGSNIATAANAEAELIGAPIPRPLCAPMKSEPDQPMKLGNVAKAELRLIAGDVIAGIRSSRTQRSLRCGAVPTRVISISESVYSAPSANAGKSISS
jgi:hypothetical protein